MEKLINEWNESDKVRTKFKDQLKKMTQEEIALAFNSNELKFGTAGYRAIVGPGNHYLNEFTYSQLSIAYARYLRTLGHMSGAVVIGTDNRIDHDIYAQHIISVMTQNGFTVYVNENDDPLPTPMLSYLIKKTGSIGGINITASHNPKEYNGVKFYNELGGQLLPVQDKTVISLMPKQIEVINMEFPIDETKVKQINSSLITEYFNDVINALGLTPADGYDKKILFSSMHGTSTNYMSKFLKGLGYDCIDFEKHNFHNHEFVNASCINPELMEAFTPALIPYADENGIDLIFATDPDADRLGVCFKRNGKWILLNGNQAGIIESYYILKHKDLQDKTPVIISTYVSNNLIDRMVKPLNGRVVRTATGFKWLANAISKLPTTEVFINAFEEAIGALPSEINADKDSFQVAGLLLEILKSYKEQKYDFIDILEKEIYPQYGFWFGRTTSKIISGTDWRAKAAKYLEQLGAYHHDLLLTRKIVSISYNEAGSCLEFQLEKDSWIKFRISGTEPKFKIYFNLFYDDVNDGSSASEIMTHLEEEANDIQGFIEQFLGIN